MKKVWEAPHLKTYGPIESITQIQLDEIVKFGQHILPDEGGFGLFSSLKIG
jgi:hypothetical protein